MQLRKALRGEYAAGLCEALKELCVSAQGLTMDEASLTGESDPMKKNTTDDPWVMSGTQVGGTRLLRAGQLAAGPR